MGTSFDELKRSLMIAVPFLGIILVSYSINPPSHPWQAIGCIFCAVIAGLALAPALRQLDKNKDRAQ